MSTGRIGQTATRIEARILIVDDEPANIRLLQRLLREEGYQHLVATSDSREARALFRDLRPDLLLLDLHMPHLDGFEVLEQIAPELSGESFVPVLVLTGDLSPASRQRALSIGAKDFVSKPFDPTEVQLRIRNLLETRFLYQELQDHNLTLEARVRERTLELEQAQLELLDRLAVAAEYRDDATGQHTQRVGRTAALLAQALRLPQADVDLIRLAAQLHDIGKIGIPDHVLLKPGRLTPEEFEIAKRHTTIGSRILSGSRFPILQLAEVIARTHHERWDGTGYTPGLAGDDIPLPGRLVAVADVFDALTHDRPYKPAWSVADALAEIDRQRGHQFDPQVVDAMLRLFGATPGEHHG